MPSFSKNSKIALVEKSENWTGNNNAQVEGMYDFIFCILLADVYPQGLYIKKSLK